METGNRFSRCLLEQKDEESRQAKRLRRRTVLIAILIQAVALGLLMLRPLFGASAEKLMIARFVPGVPWKGSREPHDPERRHPANLHSHVHDVPLHAFTFRPSVRPAEHVQDGDAPDIGPASDAPAGPGFGDPNGPLPDLGQWGNDRPMPPPPSREPEAPSKKPRVVDPAIQEARLVTRIEPVYPVLAKQTHLEGTVIIRAIISKDGHIESLEVLRGHPWLAKAALEAIARWQYRPTLLNGQPVEVETMITVVFTLR